MAFLQFLKGGVQITPNEKKTTSRRKDWNPITADLRLFANGQIYPSAVLTKRFGLEYQSKDSETTGNGFDVIDSRWFPNTAKNPTAFLMIAPVGKSEGKVDMFGSTRYNEDGTPTSSVMDQGSDTFGKDLVKMIQEVYGVTIAEGSFIDLVLVEEKELADSLKAATNGVYNVPKTIVRGDKKGTQSYVRRENLQIFVLVPASMITNQDNGGDVANTTTTQTATETVSSDMEA